MHDVLYIQCKSSLTLYCTMPSFTNPDNKIFQKHYGKRKNAYQHFLFFPQCFLSYKRNIAPLGKFEYLSANAFNFLIWTGLKFCWVVKC